VSLPLRTRVFCAVIDAARRKRLADRTVQQIQRGRRLEPPHRFPFSLVFGAVPRDVRWRDDVAVTRAGQVPVRCYEAPGHPRPGPLVMFFHGGGWVQGSIRAYDAVCAQVASRTGALVVSVGYRLAPEDPFPAAVEDCVDATAWAVSRAEVLGVDPARVAVMGDSAGGNLAAVVALVARDEGAPRIAAQVLVYPGLDGTMSSSSIDRNAHAPVLTRAKIHDFLDLYHPGPDRDDPLLSPLLADDVTGLPPALVQTASHDPLLDDGERYAERLRAAGVPVRVTEYADVPHGFLSFPGAAASGDRPLEEICAWLRETLG
jgi:acetyl esterase/lipase